jgi:hypothetical protein
MLSILKLKNMWVPEASWSDSEVELRDETSGWPGSNLRRQYKRDQEPSKLQAPCYNDKGSWFQLQRATGRFTAVLLGSMADY